MTVITTTLYYDGFGYDDDHFIGRALTKDEYYNITADEIRDAANHSIYLEELGIGEVTKICVLHQKQCVLLRLCQ